MFAQWALLFPLVILWWSVVNSEVVEDACFCGYGGVCRFIKGKPLEWNCSYCETISGGLYENCSRLVNHCESNPCMNDGKCVMTFGSFFCNCPPKFFGHTCKYRRTGAMEKSAAIVGPRAWFQVNRDHRQINQPLRFTFEDPGDNIQLQVRFRDGRFHEFTVSNFKIVDAKQDCTRDVNENKRERDIRVCESLPDKKVYSVTINTRFFLNTGYRMEKVELPSLGVTEGRVDIIHIAVLNSQRVTFSQEYRIHTSFVLFPKCGYTISFIGCTRRRSVKILHDKNKPIFLKAIRVPIDNCSSGVVDKVKWSLPTYESLPFLSRSDLNSVSISGQHLKPGKNYIDFMIIVRGNPSYFGASDLNYSYGRCWFKTVLGSFNVGIEHGAVRTVPCMSPLTLRLKSYNFNYPENELASIWKCTSDREGPELERCRKQRFLGSKIFYRTFPCGISVKFEALILHIPTGIKTNLEAEIKTGVHIDALHCGCKSNCRPTIDPRSKTKLWVDDVRMSTDRESIPINWFAWITHRRTPWEIGRFVVPETLGRAVVIDKEFFSKLTVEETKDPDLFVRAQKGHIFCEMRLRVEVPHKPLETILETNIYMKDVDDVRNKLTITSLNANLLNQPYEFEAVEILSPSVNETIQAIRAGYSEFQYLKMAQPTFVIAKSSTGLESGVSFIYSPKVNNSGYSIEEIDKMMKQTEIIVAKGDTLVSMTEIMYISRYVMVLPQSPLRLRTKLLRCLEEIIPFTFSAAATAVSSQLVQILSIINRLTVTPDLTQPPFGQDISPWVAPSNLKLPAEDVLKNNELRLLAANIIFRVSQYYFTVAAKLNIETKHSSVTRLLFQALLRYSMSSLWEPYWYKIIKTIPSKDLQFDRENNQLREIFDKSVHYLLRACDLQAEGYEEIQSLDVGTVTLTYRIFPTHELFKIGFAIFNSYQRVVIRITLKDETFSEDVYEYTTLYLGVYVEIPSRDEMTTRVHIAFFTHVTEEPVDANIEVQMRVQKPVNEESDTGHGHNMIIDYVMNPSSTRNRHKYITMYKIDFSADSDIISNNVDRNIYLHFISDSNIKIQIDANVPNYERVSRSSARGHGDFHFSVVTNQKTVYLGILPDGKNIPPDSPSQVSFEATQFVCMLRPHSSVVIGDINDKKICEIAGKKMTERATVTCNCPGPGIVYTFKLAAALFKVLSELENNVDGRSREERTHSLLYFWIITPILLVVFLIAWWRDRRNLKREFIQIMEDNFPSDTHPYIVGVFTGRQMFAGTNAKVAMQIHGTDSSSRVHILRSNSFRTLGWAQDDWFMIYTKEHLGKTLELSLWQDLEGPCPNWYCSHVVVYDVESTVWYGFPVHRWFRISEGIRFCRSLVVRGLRFSFEIDNIITFTFMTHYRRVLRNATTLTSVFFKHRRHIFSYRQKAMLVSMFLLSLLCFTIIADDQWKQGNRTSYIIPKALIALTPAFLLLALVTSVFMRSYLMTRKTRKLDLLNVREFKPTMPAVISSRDQSKSTMDNSIPFDDIASHFMESVRHPRRSQSSQKKQRSAFRTNRLQSILMANSSPSAPRVQSSQENWNAGTKWHRKRIAQKWIPDASFRPIRFDHKHIYIRYGGKVYLVMGWVLATLIVVLALVYLIMRSLSFGGQLGASVIWIILTAIALELFVVEPAVHLATSCYSVFWAKLGNLECNVLELNGLPANRKILNHLKFMELVTQPCYHPQKTERLKRLYQQYRDRASVKAFLYFLLVFTFFIIPVVLLELQNDTNNIWRLKNDTSSIMMNSVSNVSNPLSKIHKNDGISSYLLNVYLPATSLKHWYNKRPMDTARMVVPSFFTPYYSEAYGNFDPYMNKSAFISDWHAIAFKQHSSPIVDKITNNGVYGKSGLFYPQSVGLEVFIRDEKRHKALGIYSTVNENIDLQTRALVVEMSVLHPIFSQRTLSPLYGVTRVHILLENGASFPFTGSIHTSLGYAPSTKNYLRYYSFTLFSTMGIVFGLHVIVRAWQEGFALFLIFRYWVLAVCSVLSLTANALLLSDYLSGNVDVATARDIDVNTHVDFFDQFTSTYFEEPFLGPLYLCLSILLTDFLNESIGIMNGRYEPRFLAFTVMAFLLCLFFSKSFELALYFFDVVRVPRMSVIRVNANAANCDGCSLIIYFYGCSILAAKGITIACLAKGFDRPPAPHVFGYLSSFIIPRCCRKPEKMTVVDSSDEPAAYTIMDDVKSESRPPSEEKEKRKETYSSVADRLSRKFRLFE